MTTTPAERDRGKDLDYGIVLKDVGGIIEAVGRSAVRTVNAAMTAAYWLIGRRVVEYEQGGKARAQYGASFLERLSADLTSRYGRGFGIDNLQRFRVFYLAYPPERIYATPSAEFHFNRLATSFPLPWSAYVRLLSVKNENAREFYEAEALRGGWSVRQLTRQINSQFYERTALSKNKAAMLKKGEKVLPEDTITPEEEIKDPCLQRHQWATVGCPDGATRDSRSDTNGCGNSIASAVISRMAG